MIYADCKNLFDKYGIDLSEEKYQKLSDFENILIETNKVMNLTTIVETREVWIKHFLDSIIILKYIDIPENSILIDVGSGAGFPALPISIFRSDLKITCLDTLRKRVDFLNDTAEKLSIKNVNAIHERAEILGKNVKYRENFDIVTARAVANMRTLSEYCLPLAKLNGIFIAMKGPNEDIKSAECAINLLGGKTEKMIKYNIEDNERVILKINKVKNTPKKYPRNNNLIKNKPL